MIWRTAPRISLQGITYSELFSMFGISTWHTDWCASPEAYLYRLWIELRASTAPRDMWSVAIALDRRTGKKVGLEVFNKSSATDAMITHELTIRPVELSPDDIDDCELMQNAYVSMLIEQLSASSSDVARIVAQFQISEFANTLAASSSSYQRNDAATAFCQRAKRIACRIVQRLSSESISVTVAARRLNLLANIFRRQQNIVCIG